MTVEEILELMDELLDKSSSVPFSQKKMIDVEQMREYIDSIRLNLPGEIKRAKDMTRDKKNILTEANKEAEEIVKKAKDEAKKLVAQEEIIKQAAQVDIIRDLANKRVSAIFFGRCADYVLREYPNHMNVFLYAPLEARIKHMCETYDLSWPEADKLIKRVDRQRHNYYKYVTGKNRGDRDNKHLMIDVSEYGTDLTAEMICFAARKMFED